MSWAARRMRYDLPCSRQADNGTGSRNAAITISGVAACAASTRPLQGKS